MPPEQTYQIPCNRGGLTADPNIDMIPPEMLLVPSRNLNIHENGWKSRGGTSIAFTGYGGAQIMGQFDYHKADGTQFLVTTTTDGKIWKDDSTTIKTGLTVGKYSVFVVMNDEVYIFNGADVPQVWNGVAAGTSDLADIPTDWTGSSFPAWGVIHGRGNSERMWVGGCAANPNNMYASELNDGVSEADFSDLVVKVIYIETEGLGLSGCAEFGDRLFVFSELRTYIIDDTDTDTDNWGYQQAQFEGGVSHHRLIAKTQNDLVCFMEDGNIFSAISVQDYGDYKAVSITRPAFIDRWIRENVDITKIEQFHALYDPTLRCIKFFMVPRGFDEVKLALCYFVDRGPSEGWIPHDNQTNDSGYNASCSALVRVAVGEYKIYTGDYSGRAWKLETANKNDNGLGFYAGATTATMSFDNARQTKKYHRGWIVAQAQGSFNLFVSVRVDGQQKSLKTVSLSGVGGIWGTGLWGTMVWGGNELIEKSFSVGSVGKRIQYEVYNANPDEPFFISQIQQDFTNLGSRQT